MMMGMGDTSTAAATPAPTFTTGLTLWETPSSALTAVSSIFSNASSAFSSALLPFTAGVLLPPVALIVLLMGMGKKGR